ncbi:MAG: 23S rRNA (uracil(1939)-C(5))-methyltransferase RlmD [Faecousia sp.]
MLVKNQIYEAVITDYTAEGQGVAHIEGCAVFVPNAVAGEKVRLRIEKAQKTWAAGKIVELLEKSSHRINRECPVAKLCGGCDFWHMDYAEETRLKAERVRACLNRIGGENLTEVPILAAPTCYGYRNKAQYPVSVKKGRAYAGFYRAGTHDVVENTRCLILPREADAVKDTVIDYVNQNRVSVYDETTGRGLLRHIYVRRGAVSGQILVCLAVNGSALPKAEALIRQLKAIPGFTTLVLSVNTKKGNAVLGDKFITLHGPGYIEDTLCGLNFRLSPRSFYQVNHHQAQRLYQAAISQAGITKNDTVLDLYCGVGTITLAMARAAGKVIGVEVIPQAVEDAKENAVRNGIENAEFFCGDAGQAALELEKNGVKPDVVVVDPPRKGLNADTIEALRRMSPRRIVYVSCDPATLARDVALLKERGYCLKNAMAADLFPRCAHVETVVLLSKGEIDSKKVRVEFSLEDMDTSGFQQGATYGQIKEWVLEQTGLKVSSLYISQVKRKCGLDVGQNYNMSKKENAKVPQCPPEKEAAIMEALKRFQML